ncbi:RidA family protein [Sulfitobacter geojensis]|uniref:RidA family protein n=1 Tax=Sulfitobacter geojensis TaxID=1342299 RepID=A0AAE3B6R4_9RHOB|nr:RidA family protein [Sulfitobacter geojensis]MBM1689973.1 RidA family protein [Sulfitobacter geojensis]MBM1694039.1 RidA family protein [Sulfitobacter geojensis]MBM1706205.1 RidA family protein [Sulfitobacter geojensis]MBM1710263.1 RidA family protein [Sulfitobacter geojensis]MBM1714329.1 RidA family protein [Sulfitobacter geojensis]
MTIKRSEPDNRMSQTVVYGDMIYLAGQIGTGADVTAQTKDMLAEVDRLLADAGSSKSQILSATIWLADIATISEMNAVWDAWIDPANPPARACVEARLATPEFLVEVMITAAKS